MHQSSALIESLSNIHDNMAELITALRSEQASISCRDCPQLKSLREEVSGLSAYLQHMLETSRKRLSGFRQRNRRLRKQLDVLKRAGNPQS